MRFYTIKLPRAVGAMVRFFLTSFSKERKKK